MERTKANAASNEAEDIEAILQGIKARSGCGLKLMETFTQRFPGNTILDARGRKGSRSTHYDFEILVDNGHTEPKWYHVEHKGSKHYKPIDPEDRPWKAGVQFHNGGCEKYSIAKDYATLWYTHHIGSGTLKAAYNIQAPIPTFEEWFNKDCRTQDDPKTAFGLELKQAVRASGKSSLLEKRGVVVDALPFTEENKLTLKQEVLPIVQEVLGQKDFWLTIHGSLTGDFHAAWYPKLTVKSIQDVTIVKKKDVFLNFQCDNGFQFQAILRWGKGAGFSCLRIDLR